MDYGCSLAAVRKLMKVSFSLWLFQIFQPVCNGVKLRDSTLEVSRDHCRSTQGQDHTMQTQKLIYGGSVLQKKKIHFIFSKESSFIGLIIAVLHLSVFMTCETQCSLASKHFSVHWSFFRTSETLGSLACKHCSGECWQVHRPLLLMLRQQRDPKLRNNETLWTAVCINGRRRRKANKT